MGKDPGQYIYSEYHLFFKVLLTHYQMAILYMWWTSKEHAVNIRDIGV